MAKKSGIANDPTTAVHERDEAILSPIEDIIEDIRNGRLVVLVDDEGRENEGDLIVAGQMATPDAINFMARYGRGLICLTLDSKRVKQLGLPLMAESNESPHQTAFTLSIEARDGVTTGISASDRARTVAVAIDPTKGKGDIVIPGHVFPLVARDGGVLVRAGHTEAAVDLSRLAGLNPSGVICEIMNDDGTMARLPDLIGFCQLHGLKIGTIADLIAYRSRNDTIVQRIMETGVTLRYGGDLRMVVYVNKVSYTEHLALVKGDISGPEPVHVRVHAVNILDDFLHDASSGRGGELEGSLEHIGKIGRGVVVLIRESQPQSLSSQIRARYHLSAIEGSPIAPDPSLRVSESRSPILRDYGVGAQILTDLGVKDMILLTNHARTIIGLDGYGLKIVGRSPIPGTEG